MTTPSSSSSLRRNLQSPSAINENYSVNGKIIVAALVIIFFIVFLIIMLRVYARSLQRSFISRRLSLPSRNDAPGLNASTGLNKETVEALPVFTYKSQSLSPVNCVVCLLDFRQDEECKILPKCKHFFHTRCIDVWFLSNTTCPLCRRAVESSDEDGHEAYDVVGSASSCTHGVNELREKYEGAELVCP